MEKVADDVDLFLRSATRADELRLLDESGSWPTSDLDLNEFRSLLTRAREIERRR